MRLRGLAAGLVALACLTPVPAGAQASSSASPSASQPAGDTVTAADRSRTWIVIGGTSTTLRGDCQEGCPAHGTGAYLHTGSVLGVAGVRVNPQVDAGLEVSWVPASTVDGQDFRATFLLATGQFRPMASNGFFLRGGMGMVFVRNFTFDAADVGAADHVEGAGRDLRGGLGVRAQKACGLRTVRRPARGRARRLRQTGGVNNENVLGNFWSVGAALVIR